MLKKIVFTITFVFVLGLTNSFDALAGDANLDGKVEAEDFGVAQSGNKHKPKKEGGQSIRSHKRPRTKSKKDMRLKGSKIHSNNKIQPKSQKRTSNFGLLLDSGGGEESRK